MSGASAPAAQDGSSSSVVDATTKQNGLLIAPGDLVVLWISRDKDPLPITVKPGESYNNTFGRFLHDDMVGKPWGSKISARERKGYMHLLRPSAALWTLSLPHRTQILYLPDMSFIALQLNVGPGARVIEAGTGSGSFTHTLASMVGRADQWGAEGQGADAESSHAPHGRDAALRARWKWKGLADEELQGRGANRAAAKAAAQAREARAQAAAAEEAILDEAQTETMLNAPIDPAHGRVWSFEYHEVRVQRAREEFEAHGLSRIVTLSQRDVCKRGFGVTHGADALFLDVPAPWDAVPFAPAALRADITTRICCFSPCIEQVLRTVTALSAAGFTDVATYESLVRGYESVAVSSEDPGASTTLPGTARNADVGVAASRIREIEARKEDRREKQQQKSREERKRREEKKALALKRKRDDEVGEEDEAEGSAKVRRLEDGREDGATNGHNDAEEDVEADNHDEQDGGDEAPGSNGMQRQDGDFTDDFIAPAARIRSAIRDDPGGSTSLLAPANVYARPLPEMRGHTSYLTFATLLPRAVSDAVAASAAQQPSNGDGTPPLDVASDAAPLTAATSTA